MFSYALPPIQFFFLGGGGVGGMGTVVPRPSFPKFPIHYLFIQIIISKYSEEIQVAMQVVSHIR